MPHRLTPSLLFLLAVGSLHAQVGVEGVLPPSVGSAEIQAAIGSDESKAGLEKAAARLQALLREDGYFLATVIVDKLKDGRQGLRVFPGIFDGKSAKVTGNNLRVSTSFVQAIALPVTGFASLGFALGAAMDWRLVAVLAASTTLGVLLGLAAAPRVAAGALSRLIGAMMAVAAAIIVARLAFA